MKYGISFEKIYKYLVVYVRVQKLQNRPSENDRQKKCNFALMFNICDLFSRKMNDKAWPHRLNHADLCLHDFYMTYILLNTKNAYSEAYSIRDDEIEYIGFMLELANEIYIYACNLHC